MVCDKIIPAVLKKASIWRETLYQKAMFISQNQNISHPNASKIVILPRCLLLKVFF